MVPDPKTTLSSEEECKLFDELQAELTGLQKTMDNHVTSQHIGEFMKYALEKFRGASLPAETMSYILDNVFFLAGIDLPQEPWFDYSRRYGLPDYVEACVPNFGLVSAES